MSTPVLWIFLPALIGLLLFIMRRWYRTTVLVGTMTVLSLAISALFLPINELVRLGPLAFKISDSLDILGRRLFLGAQDRPLIIMIYILAAFWFCAAFEARAGRMFVPLGLTLVAVWMAVMAVEPFLYAALLLELAVLISIPLLSPPGLPLGRGVIRYLIFQTFGMPFFLLTGWLLSGVESSPGDLELVVRASTLLGFGLIFLLGIFPFHSWLPMVAEEAHPYTAAFIFFFMPLMISLFGLNFLEQYAWLRQSEQVYEILRLSGAIMMLIGGGFSVLQQHLGRMLGFATMTGLGMTLVVIGVSSLEVFFAMQIPRALALSVWALGLSIVQRTSIMVKTAPLEIDSTAQNKSSSLSRREALHFTNVQGIGRTVPVATTAIILATLSYAGYPLLSGFPVYQALWRNLVNHAPTLTILALLGTISLGVAGLRGLAVLVTGSSDNVWKVSEHWLKMVFLIFGILIMILLGLFPQWVLPYTATIARVFSQLTAQPLIP